MRRWTRFAAGVSLLFGASLAFAQNWTLTILHTNDMHAHSQPTRVGDLELGGYARLATAIRETRAQSVNPILLDGGDVFQGTLLYNVYKGMADLAFMNYIGYDAFVLGNHEFDDGPGPITQFARFANFPVLAANLDLSQEPDLDAHVQPSTVLEVDGRRVGIVGVAYRDLINIASPGPTVVNIDPIATAQAAIDELVADGVRKIIVLSHNGIDYERRLARELRHVDVVVGGHSHTLMGSFGDLFGDRNTLPYPVVERDRDGRNVLVVQAHDWGKLLGKLVVEFDSEGEVVSYSGNPIPVTAEFAEDPVVAGMLAAFEIPMAALRDQVIGSTQIELDRGQRGEDSIIAQIIADAQLEATRKVGAVAAFMNSGGIRASIPAGEITYGVAIEVQPFNNTLVVLDLTGQELIEALEHGSRGAGFLHPSRGVTLTIDYTRPAGQRIQNFAINGEEVRPDQIYRITFNSFIAAGGDAHEVLRDSSTGERIDTGLLDIDALVEFFRVNSPWTRPMETRVTIIR